MSKVILSLGEQEVTAWGTRGNRLGNKREPLLTSNRVTSSRGLVHCPILHAAHLSGIDTLVGSLLRGRCAQQTRWRTKRNVLAASLIILFLFPKEATFHCLELLFFTPPINCSHQRKFTLRAAWNITLL